MQIDAGDAATLADEAAECMAKAESEVLTVIEKLRDVAHWSAHQHGADDNATKRIVKLQQDLTSLHEHLATVRSDVDEQAQ
jgi:hypothetical protein